MKLELVDLLVVELFSVDYGVGIEGEFFSELYKGKFLFISLEPCVYSGDRDLDFVVSLDGLLDLG